MNVITINKNRIIICHIYFSRIDVRDRFDHQRFFDDFFLNAEIDNDIILNIL